MVYNNQPFSLGFVSHSKMAIDNKYQLQRYSQPVISFNIGLLLMYMKVVNIYMKRINM